MTALHQRIFQMGTVVLNQLRGIRERWSWVSTVVSLATLLAIGSSIWAYVNGVIVMYGDAESHLNIAKRVVDSLTPGMAQLGGIWLPLPHLLLVPFVAIDPLWRTGLAGSIVSGIAFVITSVYLYKLVYKLTQQPWAAFVAFLVFALNPNVLYFQATPMTELPLIAFFLLSSYYCICYLFNTKDLLALLLAGLFGLAASLTRYDGWFLILFEAIAVALVHLMQRAPWRQVEGRTLLFGTLAGFGALLWFAWDWIILGDPFYFTRSEYSAKSQQNNWLARGELPTYHDLGQSLLYYGVTALANIGAIITVVAVAGVCAYLLARRQTTRLLVLLVLFVPFIFYVATLYLGQSVIFIPQLTPAHFEFHLFNVRYGIMMVPIAAIFVGYLWSAVPRYGRVLVVLAIVLQVASFGLGKESVMTYQDGKVGLSQGLKRVDAQNWLNSHYDGGVVLMDDYARTISIVHSTIEMRDVIYVGNKPYWEQSFQAPERYARWIVMQKNDAVWKGIYLNPAVSGRLYQHFHKVYTSDEILIFERSDDTAAVVSP